MGRLLNKGVNAANQYARDVVSGSILACKWVKLACQRHLNDLAKEKSKSFPYRFDRVKAEKFCKFAGNLVHVKGEWSGQKIRLEPFQLFIACNLFGWVRKKDGFRRFKEAYVEIPRKNGKSVLAAVIGNYLFSADGEDGAEVYSGATTEKQAWEVFRPAKQMSEKSPGYKDHFGIRVGAQNLSIESNGSRFEPLIGNPGDGASPSCAIVDEYHEHKTSDLYDTMSTGMGSRRQPLMFVITTSGTNLSGPCYTQHLQIKKLLEGQFQNDELFGIIFTLDEGDKWEDFDMWKKANPCYGVSVYEDYFAGKLRTALQDISKRNSILTKNLNQWLNANTAWMDMSAWKKCEDKTLSMSRFKGKRVCIGLDLSSKIDVAPAMFVFKETIDGIDHFYGFGKYFLPEETIEKAENKHYQTWKQMELITETPGAIIDYTFIEDELNDRASEFEIARVGYDPFQATQLSTRLTDQGFNMVEIRPTVLNFSEPMKELQKLVLSGRFHHNGDPVLTWMMSNVVAHVDVKDNIYPRKERAENKIDGVVGLIMALDQCLRDRDLPKPGIGII